MKEFDTYTDSDVSKALLAIRMPNTYAKIIFILLLTFQCGFGQSDKFAEAMLYARRGSDTTLVLLNKIKPSIDFKKANDNALEYLLIKRKYYNVTSNIRNSAQVVKEAAMHYNGSTKESLKLRYELALIYQDLQKLLQSNLLEPVARAFYLKALNSNFPESQVEASILMFNLFRGHAVKDSMNYYLDQAGAIAINKNLKKKQAAILRMKGRMYAQFWDDHKSASGFYDRSSELYGKLGFEFDVARNLIFKAASYREQGYYEEAIKLLEQANVIFERQKADILVGFVHRAIGRIYQDVDNHEEAIKKLNLGRAMLPDSSFSIVWARIDTYLGNSYLALGNYDLAEKLFRSSIITKENGNNRYTLPYSYNSLGNLYLKEKKFEQAKSQFKKAIHLSEITKIKKEMAQSYLGLSQLFFEQNKLNLAQKNGLLALESAKSKKVVETKFAALTVLAKIATEKENYARANEYYQESVSLQDSVMNFGKALKVTNIISAYENKKKEFELLGLKSENQAKASELEQNELRSKLYLLGFISIVVTFLLFLRSFIQNKKARQQQQLLNASLNESNRKLSESNTQLEQFAQTASHDLKSPLTAINLFSSLLETNTKTEVGEKERRYIRHIAQSGKNLVTMIDDMLDFSKVGAQQLSLKPTNLNLVAKDTISSLYGYALENNVEVKLLTPFPNMAMADEVKLKRVFQNIIANAIKFHDGDKTHRYVHLAYKELNNLHQFSITDNGIGIPATKKNVFKPFTHLNIEDNYTGTGLGLAICEKIIKKHGGTIWYESEIEKGSSFYFTIATEENFNKSECVGKNLVNDSEMSLGC